jgi:hypothetical protein
MEMFLPWDAKPLLTHTMYELLLLLLPTLLSLLLSVCLTHKHV